MAGITEPVFRSLCREHGAQVVYTEMVSADGLAFHSRGTQELLAFEPPERPIGVQLFGAEPDRLADAAAYVAEQIGPDCIDLNSGCPVRKVVRRNGGAALMRDPVLFERIVRRMVDAVSIPVTVKIRTGWAREDLVDTEFARRAEQAGAAAVTLHARSATQMYSGQADWSRIAETKRSVGIPVVGNGDITSGADAAAMVSQTGCDAVMIARGAYGNPWIFDQCRAALDGRDAPVVTPEEKLKTALSHLDRFVARHGERRAIGEMKKHVAWYLKGLRGAPSLRNRVFRAEHTDELRTVLRDALAGG